MGITAKKMITVTHLGRCNAKGEVQNVKKMR